MVGNNCNLSAHPTRIPGKLTFDVFVRSGAIRAMSFRMEKSDAEIEALTNEEIGAGIEVHREFGPGLLESIYQECLVIVLRRAGIQVEIEKLVRIDFQGHRLKTRLKIDMLVGGCIVVEPRPSTASTQSTRHR